MTLSDRRKLLAVTAFVVAANCLDLASTYAVSPDLANEWNLLERVFGLGWLGLICAKLIGAAIAIAGYAFYLRFRAAAYPSVGVDLNSFCHHISFGSRPGSNRRESWLRLGVCLGYFWAGMQGIVIWVALENILLNYGIAFGIRQYSEMAYHMFQSAVVATLVLWRFYLGNFRRYRDLALSPVAVVSAHSEDAFRIKQTI